MSLAPNVTNLVNTSVFGKEIHFMQSARLRRCIGLHWFNFLKSSKAEGKAKPNSHPAPSNGNAEQDDASPAGPQPEGSTVVVSRNEDDGSEAATSPNGNTAAGGGGPQVEFSLPKDK